MPSEPNASEPMPSATSRLADGAKIGDENTVPRTRTSTAMTPAIFGADERNAAEGASAFSYASGTHVWNGNAPSLNANAASTNPSVSSAGRPPACSIPAVTATYSVLPAPSPNMSASP